MSNKSRDSSPKSPKTTLVESQAKPAAIPVDFARLPPSLRERAVWLCWKWVRVGGRWTKPPFSATTGAKADVTDATVLATFAQAKAGVESGRFDGLGVALEAAGLLGVDLDDCRDPAEGTLAAWAAEVVETLDSYAEVSPSGTGVKILLVAAKPGSRCRAGTVEIYDRARYFTLTGQRLPGRTSEPQHRQDELDAVYAKFLGPPATASTLPPAAPDPGDDDLLEAAFGARNGATIRRLWEGDASGYASESEADLALCTLLAFYFPDAARLDAVYRKSGLYRAKWDRDDYRAATLRKALERTTETYRAPKPVGGPPADPTRPGKPVLPEIRWEVAPLPLPTLPPVPPFPLELLPRAVADYWRAAAASIHVPVDYVAVPGLALLGAAAGRSRSAAIKRTYSKPPLLWCVLIAPPSGGKSPALALAAAPLWKAEARWRERYADNLATYEIEADRYKVQSEAWRKKGCEGEPPRKPYRPHLRQAVLDDATVEAAVRVLRENPRGVVLAKDELSGFVLALNQYKGGKGADRQFWLSAWAGAAVKVNRSGDKESPPLFVPNPFAAVAGALCPEVLPTLRGDVQPGDAPADGFIDRFLMSWPDPLPAVGETWREIPEDVEAAYCDVVLNLLNMDLVPPAEGFTLPQPWTIRFDDAAKAVWQRFTDGVATRLNARDPDDPFRATLGKLREYGLRLAALLWCLRQAASERPPSEILHQDEPDPEAVAAGIDAEIMTAAAALVDYFEAHARRCHGLGATDRIGRVARRLRDWLDARPGTVSFFRSQAFQQLKDKRDVRNGEALNAPLNLLCDHGYLRLIAGDGGGRPGPVPQTYEVNPLWKRTGTPVATPNISGDFGDGFPVAAAAKEGV